MGDIRHIFGKQVPGNIITAFGVIEGDFIADPSGAYLHGTNIIVRPWADLRVILEMPQITILRDHIVGTFGGSKTLGFNAE